MPKFDCSSYENKKESDTVSDFLWWVFIRNECTLMRRVLTITLRDLCYCVFICNPFKINHQDKIAAVLFMAVLCCHCHAMKVYLFRLGHTWDGCHCRRPWSDCRVLCVRAHVCVHLSVRKQVYMVYNFNINIECDYIGNSSVSNYHLFPARAIS